jgi:hypothetical protein
MAYLLAHGPQAGATLVAYEATETRLSTSTQSTSQCSMVSVQQEMNTMIREGSYKESYIAQKNLHVFYVGEAQTVSPYLLP